MMEAKDWISLFVGMIVTALGALPLLSKILGSKVPSWFTLPWLPINIFAYLVAGFGFYLLIESVIEITNSNSIGWISFLVATLFLGLGVLQVLSKFGIGPSWFSLGFISQTVYHVIFVVEGIFLMIACFAMEI